MLFSGLPPSPPSLFPNSTGSGGGNGNNAGPNAEDPFGVDINRKSEKLGGGIIAVVALSSAVAVVICLSVLWFMLLKCTNQNRKPPTIPPTFVSATTKRSGKIVI